jgi:hypothetical protein
MEPISKSADPSSSHWPGVPQTQRAAAPARGLDDVALVEEAAVIERPLPDPRPYPLARSRAGSGRGILRELIWRKPPDEHLDQLGGKDGTCGREQIRGLCLK